MTRISPEDWMASVGVMVSCPGCAFTFDANHRDEDGGYSCPLCDDFDLAAFANAKAQWSRETFGPGDRYAGVIAHIRKELLEIEADPRDLVEWVDVILLAMDGAWRSTGADGSALVAALLAKQAKNVARKWKDWRTLRDGEVSEHVKGVERCNRHSDCVAADVEARKAGRVAAEHCDDSGCEECFGS